LVENGSWACKSGDLMQKFLEEEMKGMTVINQRLSLASAMGEEKEDELEALANAIVDSIIEES
ncbi:MAG TPA: FprA family A-type flavoprotein, partial [Clostridiales bacterium]|nr:FprA family A-type flavoprotein [Clostridiales bacterium]